MDKKLIAIIVMGILLLSASGVIAYNQIEKIKVEQYQAGIKDNALLINKQIVSNIIENGQITVYISNNQSIRLIPEQVCVNQINQTKNNIIQECQNYIKQLQGGKTK